MGFPSRDKPPAPVYPPGLGATLPRRAVMSLKIPPNLLVAALVVWVAAIGYFDHTVGFGFHLFPLYLMPVALAAWNARLKPTLFVSLLAGAMIVFKIYLTREQYADALYWYWDAAVKFTLLQMMAYGLWRIRALSLLQQRQSTKRIDELNESLKRQVERLTATNRELEAFSYTISHDLRAPIRHIIGFVDLLNARNLSGLDEKSRHYLQVISDSARKMGDLIDGLLAYTQLGRTGLHLNSVDLFALVQDIERKLEAQTAGRNVQWLVGRLPMVLADPDMLRQVMAVLMENAVKFTRGCEQARIEIGATVTASETTVHVKDNGAGFDMKFVGKLFGVFQRLHANEEFPGTGIGLAMVRRIVSRHGGRVWAEGAVGRGATISFSLPSSPPEGEPVADAPPSAKAQRQ